MKKTVVALLVLGILFIMLTGCAEEKKPGTGTPPSATLPPGQRPPAQPEPEKEEFILGSEFSVKKAGIYSNAETGVKVSPIDISDSRCKPGVQCVWQGEQGIRLRVSDSDRNAEVSLGEITRKKDNFLTYYSVELVSIDASAGSAVVKVTKREQAGKLWFFFEPKQCGTNAWEKEGTEESVGAEEDEIKAWLQGKGIQVLSLAKKKVYDVVCAACTCPRGDRIVVLVDQKGSAKMEALGWELLNKDGTAFCAEDVKICPDGTTVAREAPFCEFPECAKRDFYVKKVDVPGFVPEPVFVTTVIDSNRAVIVETKEAGSEGGATIENRTATKAQLDELRALVDTTSFFSLGPKDMKICIIDAPTVDLTVVSGGKANSLYGIGAWCDPNKLQGIDKVISKIGELAGREKVPQ